MNCKPFSALFIFLFLILFSVEICGQSVFGVNGGLYNKKLMGDKPTAGFFGIKKGNKFGINYDFRFNQTFSINSGISREYVELKYVYADTTSETEKDSLRLEVSSISVPLSAVVWSENGRFFVMAGIEILMPVSFKGYKQGYTYSYLSDIRKIVFNAHFGAGFIIPVGKPHIFCEVKYSQGLTDTNNPTVHSSDTDNFPRTKTYSLSLSFGIKIPIGEADHYEIKNEASR